MGQKNKKPPEYNRFESRSFLEQDYNGNWKHRYTAENGKRRTETTTALHYSLLTSDAFKDLTASQRMLYVYAKTQFYGAVSRPAKDFKDIKEYQEQQGRMFFYLNHKLMTEVFGLYAKSNHRSLYRDVQALEDHGFIERVTNIKTDGEKGGNIEGGNHMRTIYKYSEDWKDWKPKN